LELRFPGSAGYLGSKRHTIGYFVRRSSGWIGKTKQMDSLAGGPVFGYTCWANKINKKLSL